LKANKIQLGGDYEYEEEASDTAPKEIKNAQKAVEVPDVPQFSIDPKKIMFKSVELKLTKKQKNVTNIVEILNKNGVWSPKGEIKAAPKRIDGLEANTEYFVRIMAKNRYGKKKVSGQKKFKTLAAPKIKALKLESVRNLSICLDDIPSCVTNDERDMMIQFRMSDTDADDGKEEWIDVQNVQKGQYDYKSAAGITAFYKVRFKVDCDGYSEFSEVASFSSKELMKNSTKDLLLQYSAHRGHGDEDWSHPKKLLSYYDYYVSKKNNEFKPEERDWVEFQMDKGSLIQQVCIQNQYGDGHDVKSMSVSVGDGSGKWIPLKSNGQSIIHVAKGKDMQVFEIDADGQPFNYEFMKLELIDNHGTSNPTYSKFCVKQFKVRGI